jgi:hypothetical protein
MTKRTFCVVGMALSTIAVGCSGGQGVASDTEIADSTTKLTARAEPSSDSADLVYGINRHVLPWGESALKPEPEPRTAVPEGAQVHARGRRQTLLTYYGGPVLSNVKVVQVLYGTGTYLSNITSTSTPSLASFYGQITNSAYFSWLTEYDTRTQTIGLGSFVKQVTIAPASSRDGSTISDTSIEAEISAQIGAGTLPTPDANTVYMVNFPKGKQISLSGTPSCKAGGFCAYHSTFTRNGTDVFYGVLPDMSPGSGCDVGCGGSTQFNNQTSVASHELVESTTDPAVGLATTFSPPLAWYNANLGEIGDICNAQQGTIVGADGITYTVQKEWSNALQACIVHK